MKRCLITLWLLAGLLSCSTPGRLVYEQTVLPPTGDSLCVRDWSNTSITVQAPGGIRNPGWGSNSQLRQWDSASSAMLGESLRQFIRESVPADCALQSVADESPPELVLTIADVWPPLGAADVASTIAGVLLVALTVDMISPPDGFYYSVCLEHNELGVARANGRIRWSGSTWYMMKHPEATYDITYQMLDQLSRQAWWSLIRGDSGEETPCSPPE